MGGADATAPRKAGESSAYDLSAESNYTGQVLKSTAAIKNWHEEIPTSIEGINDGAQRGSVNAGVGYVEVSGESVAIYRADGVKIASGAGRYEVPAGVYVVRTSGLTQKVIVR